MQNEALEQTINGLGYEMVEATRDARGILRITIDKPAGVGTLDCDRVSNHLGYYLPVEGIDYNRLEVSSPGADRVLTKPAHYERFYGRKAKLTTFVPMDGRSNFTGTIDKLEKESVNIVVDGKKIAIRLDEIKSARLCLDHAKKKTHNKNKAGRHK